MRPHMRQNRSTTTLLAVGAVLGAAAIVLAAVQSARPASPTRLATVNLPALIDRLQEKAEWETRINGLRQRIEDEKNLRLNALKDDVEKLKAITDEEGQRAALEAAQIKKLELDQWALMKGNELDREVSLMWRQIYKHVREEAAKLAESRGYDYVIVAEPGEEIDLTVGDQRIPLTQRALEQIGRRRLLYSSPANDLTEELRSRMDNVHQLNMPAPGAGGPAPKPGP